jgi:ubiquitin-conjugating enzyme E2 variant
MDEWWGQLALAFLLAFCATTLPTNQVHQWAHMPIPPKSIQWIQNSALILRKQAHSRHHTAPYVQNYCIATGWCNPLLNALDFFSRFERFVTRITGLQPRADDSSFQNEIEINRMTKSCAASSPVDGAESHA